MTNQSLFEKHPVGTISCILLLIGLIIITGIEFLAEKSGLGDPVLYQSHPIYGYRPYPNQTKSRFHQSTIHLNNLALRTNVDWDDNPNNKILFLGDSVTYGGSYIDNDKLFSHLVSKNSTTQSGNAGVNGWGVLNVYALVHDYRFLPAKSY